MNAMKSQHTFNGGQRGEMFRLIVACQLIQPISGRLLSCIQIFIEPNLPSHYRLK